MKLCSYELQCMPNPMMRRGDVKSLLYVCDVTFRVFLLRGGGEFETHSNFFLSSLISISWYSP